MNVPRAGRYALHKLIVAGRRATRAGGVTKAGKDRAQASALLRVLLADLPGEISLAWKALSRRGKGWVERRRGQSRAPAWSVPGRAELLCRVSQPAIKDARVARLGRACSESDGVAGDVVASSSRRR